LVCITKSKTAVNCCFLLLTMQSYEQKKGGGNIPSPYGNLWENLWQYWPKWPIYGNFWEFLGILWKFFMGVF